MNEYQNKSILMIAGEASGDLLGSGLVHFLKKKLPECRLYGIGGDQMIREGLEILYHVRDMSFLGFFEVIKHLPFIHRVFNGINTLIKERRPDLVLLIDYPGFNLRIAKRAKKSGVPVIYYISPQVWAWGKKRIKKIARIVDKMLVLFPFEVDLYRREGIDVEFVGHPLKDIVTVKTPRNAFLKKVKLSADKPTVGLLPGSRKQEVFRLLPEMICASRHLKEKNPDIQFLLGKSPTLTDTIYDPLLLSESSIRSIRNSTYEIMTYSDLVLVASGTATLETAICETPMIIVYKMSALSFLIGKMLVKVKQIGLANIVAGKKIVPELLQKQAEGKNIAQTAWQLLNDPDLRNRIRKELSLVSRRLGKSGASERAAEAVIAFLNRKCIL
jgi:lipid-A-disaccharide synthase